MFWENLSMKTNHYETLLLTHTNVTEDELAAIEKHFDSIASKGEGKLATFDKWGKYLLAYPVKKNSYGLFALARYSIDQKHVTSLIQEIESFLKIKCNDIVLRHATVRLEGDSAEGYQKPDSLQAAETNNFDSLKDGKFENLLDSVDTIDNADIEDIDVA